MTLGERLRELRQKRGLSQEEVAQKLFLSRQSVSKWENDQAEPGVENLKVLAGLYEVSVDVLVGNETAPEPPPEEQTEEAGQGGNIVGLYWTFFVIRTVLVVVSNQLFSIPNNSINFPMDWIFMIVGLFLRKRPVWWMILVCIVINVTVSVISMAAGLYGGTFASVANGVILCLFCSKKIKAYFHIPETE